ncbi:MAG: hypothetical protein WD063_08545 [Pirellulales bacterium]
MSLIFLEGFDAYGSSGIAVGIQRKWNIASDPTFGAANQTGRLGGHSWRAGNNRHIARSGLGNNADMTAGVAINPENLNDTSARILGFWEASNEGINLRATSSGAIEVRLGSTLLETSAGGLLTPSTWATIELSVHTHNSSGSYDVQLNGTSILSDSGIDTQPGSNAYCDTVRLGPTGSVSTSFYYDDFYCRDDSTFMNTWKISTIFPNGDGAVDGTPSTGVDLYAMVDDASADDDSTYVTNIASDSDLFDYQSLTNVTQVYAVAVNAVVRETDASHFDIALVAKSGSTTDASTPQSVGTTSYVNRFAIWEQNPDTSSDWSPSEINAAQFGIEVS